MTADSQAGPSRGEDRPRGRALPGPLHQANETLAFLLELAMLAGLAWWGTSVTGPAGIRVLLAVAAPVAAAVVWGLLLAPRARIRLAPATVLVVKAVMFGLAALAVYTAGLHVWAVAVGIIAFLSACLATADRDASGGGGRDSAAAS